MKRLLVLLSLVCGCATTNGHRETVTLSRVVHFVDPQGAVVSVPAGTYQLVDQGDARLRLVPKTGATLVLPTISTAHDEKDLAAPRAVSAKLDEDVHSVALLLPWGVALDARGTYSGARPRGGTIDSEPVSILPTLDVPLTLSLAGADFHADGTFARLNRTEAKTAAQRPLASVEPHTTTMSAPLALPQGAVIQRVTLFYFDNDPYADLQCRFYMAWGSFPDLFAPIVAAEARSRTALSTSRGGYGLAHAALFPNGFTAGGESAPHQGDHPMFPVVDNAWAYWIEVAVPEGYDSWETRLVGVRVQYKLP